MAPAKKSKNINKGFAAGDKSKHKKQKLSDMLGPQWGKHELARFYEAYRKYGHDWKKVAMLVGSRSKDMVEALYNMNRAYLSLPEGTASVAGLIAMMIDHYNVMGGKGIQRDHIEPLVMARKFPKHSKVKGWLEAPREELFQRQPIEASDGRLSLLKLRLDGVQPSFPVRKRTPRVPVSSLDAHLNKNSPESIMNKNQDAVLHGAFLARARQTPSTQQVEQSTCCDIERIKPSEVLVGKNVPPRFGKVTAKHSGTAADEESPEDSLGSRKAKNGDMIRDFMDSNNFVVTEYKKGKKKAKKGGVVINEAEFFSNFADRGQRGQFSSEGACAKILGSADDPRWRNENLIIEDERVACDALQTLAEMSLMMPYLSSLAVEDAGESVTEQNTIVDLNNRPNTTLKDKRSDGGHKKKRKSHVLKVGKAGLHSDDCKKVAENETLADEEAAVDTSAHISTVSKRFKSSAKSPDVQMREAEVVVSSSQVPPATPIANSTRRKHHRKRDKVFLEKDKSYTQSTCSSEGSSLLRDSVQCVEKVSHCLSWRGVRKWCVYEWFYSAIDYPWFAKREFVEYLNHVGLGHIPRLTHVEWGVIRSSLGKPRRFSERFLHEEREKLKQYRDSVRTHYANLRTGLGEGLPTDLAQPLSVGQQVVAIHPKTREIHNGSVLTVDRHSCLVQFNLPDLGVESVLDIDCMPVNPLENMPEALRQKMIFDYRYPQLPNANELSRLASEGHIPSTSTQFANDTKVNSACVNSYANLTKIGGLRIPSIDQTQPCTVDTVNLRGCDITPIPRSTQNLCRKGLEHHTGSGNRPCWSQRSIANSAGLNGDIYSSNNSVFRCQEAAFNVAEIVGGSRDKAQRMVDIAIKEMCMMKEGEDVYGRIGEALDATSGVEYATTGSVSTLTSSNGSLCRKSSGIQFTSEFQMVGDMSEIKSANGSVEGPSDLIASCLAALLMIQSCTERQYPPSEVAEILEDAVRRLQPRCSQNIGIYREIELCMGRIKTQILGLVPS